MSGFIEGEDRTQATLFPERIDDYIAEENAVRVIDVFVDELDLSGLGFKIIPELTGRPAYHPAIMLKLYIYGYLNRIQSSRRLEREAGRNVELMWLLGRLAPDFKTIADFRKNNGEAIRLVCREFVMLCRKLNLFSDAFVAIDGSLHEIRYSTASVSGLALARMIATMDDIENAVSNSLEGAEDLRSWVPEIGDVVELRAGGLAVVSDIREDGLLELDHQGMSIVEMVPVGLRSQAILRVINK